MLSYNIRLSSTLNTSHSKFSKIRVAIDGSEHSLKAAEYALEVSKSFNSRLFAVTVTSIPESYRLRQEDVLGESREMADSRAWLEKFSHEAKTGNIELKTELTNSHRLVDYVILEYAEEKNIDLIVVGTRGRSGFKRLLLGSVASSVVSYAHCPVMIVVKRARRYFLLEAHFVRSSNKLHNNFH